jgi:hypothetical protein
VLVDGWTMAANKTTSDYPAPITSGNPLAFYTGTSPVTQVSAKQVVQGNRYTNPTTAFQIVSYFVYTFIGEHYDVYLVVDPLGDRIVTSLASFTGASVGWAKFNVTPVIVDVGSTFDLIAVTTEPADTPVTVDYTYNYLTPQNAAVPASGEIQHPRSQPDVMGISHFDDGGTDRSATITGLVLGDRITAANGGEWIVQANTNEGAYSTILVSPATVGTAGVQVMSFETSVPTPIDYMEDVGYWPTTPYSINGVVSVDDTYVNAIINDNAYGVDLEVVPVSVSEDWDIVAPGDAAASGSQALSRDEKTWVQASSTSLELDTAITSGNAWTEIARFPISVDTGVKASLTVDASRTDAYGKYNAEYAALAFNNAGTLDVNGAEKFELGPAQLTVRATADGTDLVFEVRGAVMQDWAWRMLIFFREVQ